MPDSVEQLKITSIMQTTPKGFRLHLGIFGRRNVGKSSLLNALTRQQTALVSEQPGTTTDPVEKLMELLPIGPVMFIDTAGVDDEGALGNLRTQKTREVFDRVDVGIVVSTEAQEGGCVSDFERRIVEELRRRDVPVIFVANKIDKALPTSETLEILRNLDLSPVFISTLDGQGISVLKDALIHVVPEDFLTPPPIVADLVTPGEMIVLVVPIDQAAPKGRLILPQVQTIRDMLDAHGSCVVVQDAQLESVLARLKTPPALVVTDSQAFATVSKIVPETIPLTSFSILFARQKGDLQTLIDGARTIGKLRDLQGGARILVAEACSHCPTSEDIGRVKIPAALQKYLGNPVTLGHVQGHDFPVASLADWDLVIHCGACVWNRREMLSRMLHCQEAGVPITNYGLAMAFMLGIFGRALQPFDK